MTLYLLRHAHAGSRPLWDRDDSLRPLSEKGRHQAEALTAHLDGVAVDRVLSSRAVRCQQTVAPLARERSLPVEVHEALTEGAAARTATTLLWQLATDRVDAVLCSHGDVIPAALDALRADGVVVDDRAGLPKGTLYVLDVDGEGVITRATFDDPRP